MYINNIENEIVIELTDFDIDRTVIEFGDNFTFNKLKIPKKYKNKRNYLLSNIIDKNLRGNVEYV